MSVQVLRGDARHLPLEDNSVDLVCTSPPYFGLRSYQDGGEHFSGQLGDEATPAEFVDALIEVTRELMRVVKPSGSIWVNLGDKYGGFKANPGTKTSLINGKAYKTQHRGAHGTIPGTAPKSLIGIPWRYALRYIDDLGLILRAEVIWSKPNGLPESVTDRVRRSHEQWFHFVLNPRYYSAVDEIREEHQHGGHGSTKAERVTNGQQVRGLMHNGAMGSDNRMEGNPLGKLPGSVWTIATQPLTVPPELGVDHFAAFPMEWPRRIVTGWSPREVCTACGEGRRPVVDRDRVILNGNFGYDNAGHGQDWRSGGRAATSATVTGYACACPDTTAPATPGTVLDPFGGTGTTALVAHALGRHGISVDMSADYCRLAQWRTSDPKELARAQQREYVPPREQVTGQDAFDFGEATA